MFRDRSATDTTLELLFNPEDAESLLFQMSMEELIAQRTEAIYQAALDKQAQAEALALELEQSRIELEDIEAEAEQLYQEAQDAADAVIAKVAQSERERATMMEQLAELKDTAEEIERQRQEGLEWERRQAAIRAAPTAPELYTVGEPDWAQVETAIAFAEEQLGERYVLGGAGPNVWDCSGITMKSYAAAGVYIGWHSATAQYNVLAKQKKLVPFQNAQRGDLIWWSTESAFSGDKYHVAIYLGDGMMLEAPNPARTVRIVPVRYGELWPYAGRPTASSN
jgi:cell wall-associated NlpC family hydrolase